MGRILKALGLLVAVGCALAVEAAHATTQPAVVYQPPVLKALDYELHNSEENVVLEPNGRYALGLRNTPVPFGISPESDAGCGFFTGGVTCPAAGLKRVIVQLGAMNDTGSIDLGRHARRIKQRVVGGSGIDEITGGGGSQRLLGGPDNDVLVGGPGRDILIGGPGKDTCIGGPGRDVIRSCE